MLEIRGLDCYYGESRAVSNLCISVKKGGVTSIIGRNGVGKSTALKSIMGLVKARGEILFEGQDIMRMPSYGRARLGIGYVPQGRDIFPQMTVKENIEIGLKGKKGIPSYIFELFPILPQFAKRKGGDLSGGQQQQLAIARALAPGPKLLILDEPTEGIQPSIIDAIGDAIKGVCAGEGITVLLAEQYLDFVLGLTGSLYIMDKGTIALSGQAKDLDKESIQKILIKG